MAHSCEGQVRRGEERRGESNTTLENTAIFSVHLMIDTIKYYLAAHILCCVLTPTGPLISNSQ